MTLKNPNADIFVPDGLEVAAALESKKPSRCAALSTPEFSWLTHGG